MPGAMRPLGGWGAAMVRHGAVEVRACGRGPFNVVERRRRRAVPGRALQQRSASASASTTPVQRKPIINTLTMRLRARYGSKSK